MDGDGETDLPFDMSEWTVVDEDVSEEDDGTLKAAKGPHTGSLKVEQKSSPSTTTAVGANNIVSKPTIISSAASTKTPPVKEPAITPTVKGPANTPAAKTPIVKGPANTPAAKTPIVKGPANTPAVKTPIVTEPAKTTIVKEPANSTAVKQPAMTPTVTQPGKTPTVTQPAKTPTVTQPAKTPTVTQPAKTPTVTQPGKTPTVTQPAKTPTMTQPAKTPTVMQPAKTPPVTQPAKTPTVTQPAKTPTVTQPAKTPTVTQPAKTPTVTQPAKTPPVTQPAKTPTVTQPAKTPAVTQPAKTPTMTQPLKTPTVTQPAKTPTVTQPAKTPTVTQPAKTPPVTQPTMTPTGKVPVNSITIKSTSMPVTNSISSSTVVSSSTRTAAPTSATKTISTSQSVQITTKPVTSTASNTVQQTALSQAQIKSNPQMKQKMDAVGKIGEIKDAVRKDKGTTNRAMDIASCLVSKGEAVKVTGMKRGTSPNKEEPEVKKMKIQNSSPAATTSGTPVGSKQSANLITKNVAKQNQNGSSSSTPKGSFGAVKSPALKIKNQPAVTPPSVKTTPIAAIKTNEMASKATISAAASSTIVPEKRIIRRFHRMTQTVDQDSSNKLLQGQIRIPSIYAKSHSAVQTVSEMIRSEVFYQRALPDTVRPAVFKVVSGFDVNYHGSRNLITGCFEYGISLGHVTVADVEKSMFRENLLTKSTHYNLYFNNKDFGVVDLFFAEEEQFLTVMTHIRKMVIGPRHLVVTYFKNLKEKERAPGLTVSCVKATIIYNQNFASTAFLTYHKAPVWGKPRVEETWTIHNMPEGIPLDFLKLIIPDAITIELDDKKQKFTQEGSLVHLGMNRKNGGDRILKLFAEIYINNECLTILSSGVSVKDVPDLSDILSDKAKRQKEVKSSLIVREIKGVARDINVPSVVAKNTEADVVMQVDAVDDVGKILTKPASALKSASSVEKLQQTISQPKSNLGQNIKAPVNLGQNIKAPVNLGQNIKAPVNLGQNIKAPVNLSQNIKAPVNLGQNIKAPVNVGQNIKAPVNPGQNVKTPVNLGQNIKTPVNLGQNIKTPVNPGQNIKTPVNSGQNIKTPVNLGQNIKTPVKDLVLSDVSDDLSDISDSSNIGEDSRNQKKVMKNKALPAGKTSTPVLNKTSKAGSKNSSASRPQQQGRFHESLAESFSHIERKSTSVVPNDSRQKENIPERFQKEVVHHSPLKQSLDKRTQRRSSERTVVLGGPRRNSSGSDKEYYNQKQNITGARVRDESDTSRDRLQRERLTEGAKREKYDKFSSGQPDKDSHAGERGRPGYSGGRFDRSEDRYNDRVRSNSEVDRHGNRVISVFEKEESGSKSQGRFVQGMLRDKVRHYKDISIEIYNDGDRRGDRLDRLVQTRLGSLERQEKESDRGRRGNRLDRSRSPDTRQRGRSVGPRRRRSTSRTIIRARNLSPPSSQRFTGMRRSRSPQQRSRGLALSPINVGDYEIRHTPEGMWLSQPPSAPSHISQQNFGKTKAKNNLASVQAERKSTRVSLERENMEATNTRKQLERFVGQVIAVKKAQSGSQVTGGRLSPSQFVPGVHDPSKFFKKIRDIYGSGVNFTDTGSGTGLSGTVSAGSKGGENDGVSSGGPLTSAKRSLSRVSVSPSGGGKKSRDSVGHVENRHNYEVDKGGVGNLRRFDIQINNKNQMYGRESGGYKESGVIPNQQDSEDYRDSGMVLNQSGSGGYRDSGVMPNQSGPGRYRDSGIIPNKSFSGGYRDSGMMPKKLGSDDYRDSNVMPKKPGSEGYRDSDVMPKRLDSEGYRDSGVMPKKPDSEGYRDSDVMSKKPDSEGFRDSGIMQKKPGSWGYSGMMPNQTSTGGYRDSGVMPNQRRTGGYRDSGVIPNQPSTGGYRDSGGMPNQHGGFRDYGGMPNQQEGYRDYGVMPNLPGSGGYSGGMQNQSGSGGYSGGMQNQSGSGGYSGGMQNQSGSGGYSGGMPNQSGSGGYSGGMQNQSGSAGFSGGMQNQSGSGDYSGVMPDQPSSEVYRDYGVMPNQPDAGGYSGVMPNQPDSWGYSGTGMMPNQTGPEGYRDFGMMPNQPGSEGYRDSDMMPNQPDFGGYHQNSNIPPPPPIPPPVMPPLFNSQGSLSQLEAMANVLASDIEKQSHVPQNVPQGMWNVSSQVPNTGSQFPVNRPPPPGPNSMSFPEAQPPQNQNVNFQISQGPVMYPQHNIRGNDPPPMQWSHNNFF